MDIDEAVTGRVLSAAQDLCLNQGGAMTGEVADITGLDRALVASVLVLLARRGDLIARPGAVYVRSRGIKIRMPGAGYPTDLARPNPLSMMKARA